MNHDAVDTKILFLASNPNGTDRLRLDEEARDIEEGLRRSEERERFTVKTVWAVRARDIRRAIIDFKPNVVHFSGHGTADGGLALENTKGLVQLVSPEALSGLFKLLKTHIKCVVLNACYSENQAIAITEHISFVVGMSQKIGDQSAIEFSVGFYDALMAGYSIEDAYEFGCNAICMAGLEENHTPVLKKRYVEPTPDISSQSVAVLNKVKFPDRPAMADSSTVEYVFVLSGHIKEADTQKVKAIESHLRKVTGDTTLTLLKIEPGSIKLTFEGSERGFQELYDLFHSGALSQVEGFIIQHVHRREVNSSAPASTKSNEIFQRVHRREVNSSAPASTKSNETLSGINSKEFNSSAQFSKKLNKSFEEVLAVGTCHPIFVLISSYIRQNHLQGKYDAMFVLNEAYLRAYSAIRNGREISNYSAWIRLTSSRIVQELRRDERKREYLPISVEEDLLPVSTYFEEDLLYASTDFKAKIEDKQRIRIAFKMLTKHEQTILKLKVIQELTWEDMQIALAEMGYPVETPSRLHQINTRALKKLKKKYHEVNSL